MNEPTDLVLPKSLPYPIKVTKILVSPGDNIRRGTPLLYYSYKHYLREDKTTETCYGTWESYVEGRVDLWNIDLGDEVDKDYGPVLVVTEPCKHGTQIMGMCADCGKDMTEVDYMSIAGTERAKIKMDHGAEGPLLSQEVAAKIERENTDRLLKSRKLSLIVDLDQTILHATFDPTVGEWIKAKDAFKKHRSTTPPETEPPPESVNWPALEDVISFQLPSDHGHMGHSERYYVKPRPGLQQFMNKLSELYEMHVYTMGVRSYANAICAALDPSGAWFGSRVLSRNESGSDRVKNLKRLFPSDQSMVIVIDDRADVWNWSPNLVRVIPFEFFVGTGDINASFLPKQTSTEAVPPTDPKTGEPPQEDIEPESEVTKQQEIQAEDAAKQLKERPLEKAQEALVAKVSSTNDGHGDKEPETTASAPIPLLKNDDNELDRIERILCDIHKEFYELYDTRQKSRNHSAPDVLGVIPGIKAKTLAGVHLVFSGILPLDGRPERQPIWKAALEFGATCHVDINPQVTHLVTNKLGTVKADKAFARGNIFVVNVKWFNDSLIKWERQPEENYLMERKPKNSSQDSESKKSEPPPDGVETKVGGEDDTAGHGPDIQSSVPHNANEESFLSTPAAEPGQNEEVELHIDWAEIDKEVEDALASDDDDDGDEDLADEGEPKPAVADSTPEPRYMVGITPTTRGIKRPRSDDSTPSTPSRLRFSFNAADLARDSSPKRQKLNHEPLANGTSKPSTQDPPESQVADTTDQTGDDTDDDEDDDDDDFLAREMAEDD